MKRILLAVLAAFALPAFAQVDIGTQISAGVTNSPTTVIQGATSPDHTTSKILTNATASPGSVLLPSVGDCSAPGKGHSVTTPIVGWNVADGTTGDKGWCVNNAQAVNLKATGASDKVVKATHCQDLAKAISYEDAGEPCPDRLRPQNRDASGNPKPYANTGTKTAEAAGALVATGVVAPKGWEGVNRNDPAIMARAPSGFASK